MESTGQTPGDCQSLAALSQPESILRYPDDGAATRYAALVGMDDVKSRLHNELALRLAPERLADWSQRYGHQRLVSALSPAQSRAPVIVLLGDSGTGKTALAESLGDPLARSLRVGLRGHRIGADPSSAEQLERALNPASGVQVAGIGPTPGIRGHIFICDQHYPGGTVPVDGYDGGPDPAAVVQALQAAEALAARGGAAVVIVCVSHPTQIDPAVRRLSLEPFLLSRPNAAQRETVLRRLTVGLPVTDAELVRLVRSTGPRDGTPGYTYGDLAQRLMQAAILESYPDRALTVATLIAVARRLSPTPAACATDLENSQPTPH